MKKNRKAAILGGLIAFIVPLLFIGKIWQTGAKYRNKPKHNFLMPVLGERTYMELTKDTMYHQIKEFSFKSIAGTPLENNTFKEDIRLVTFADTSSLNTQINWLTPLLEQYPITKTADRNYANVYVIQHLELPQNAGLSIDNPEMKNWHIVARSKFSGLRESYLIEKNQIALVDQDERVRAIYNFTDADKAKLTEDIQHLLREMYYTNKKRNRRTKLSE